MYKILKQYMNEHYANRFTEVDKVFAVHKYYASMSTFVQHKITADKNGFYCVAELPVKTLYDEDYYEFQIEIIARINNDLEHGKVVVNEENKTLTFCTEFTPQQKYNEFSRYYYDENITKMLTYGENVFDDEYGRMIDDTFVWWGQVI